MMIHEITEKVGKYKKRKRIGRGQGSGTGKTAGRGHKGAGSRSGWSGSQIPGFEGGQMPYFRRVPKRGFNNANFAKKFAIVNLHSIEERFDDGAEVNPEMLVKVGLLPDTTTPVKVLGSGELTKKVSVAAHKFSESARAKIENAGGGCTLIA